MTQALHNNSRIGALTPTELLKGPYLINGVSLNLSHAEMPQSYKPIGLQLIGANSSEDELMLMWAPNDALDSLGGLLGTGSGVPNYIALKSGDFLIINRLSKKREDDPNLVGPDLELIEAELALIRDGKKTELYVPMTFANSAFMDDGQGLVRPNLDRMKLRLAILDAKVSETKSTDFLLALTDCTRRSADFHDHLASYVTAADVSHSPDHFALYRLCDAAAAFGYSLARAEAELVARPGLRQAKARARRAGQARGVQKKANADAWKAEALDWAVQNDKPAITRSALATALIFQFDWKNPDHKTVENWLKYEAEQPVGPLRSRARKRREA